MGIKNVKLKMRYIFVAASSARNSRVRREESEECVPDHELEMFCQNNSEEDCASSVICSWCEDSCNVNGTAVASCLSNKDGRNQTIFECVFELKKSALAEGKSLSSEEQKLILDTIGDLPADEENSEARSGFMGLFTGDSAFGMRSDPMIPYDLMGVQSRISAQFINCPVNVPFCQRQECSSSFGNINTALFQQMGVSNQNPFFATNAQVPTCPRTPAKLNCMAPPAEDEKIDAMFMLNTPKMCEVKGCCWDQGLMQQLLLARKSDSINNIQQFQCPWRAPTVGSKWGLPDLSESLKGCCSISPCVHTELPAEWTLWGEWTQCTAKCGGGESIRSRSCIGNGFCPGMIDDTQREDIVSRVCGQVPCESWSLWAPWGQCSASCGKGTHQRFRSCTDINGLDVAPPGVSGGCRGNDASSQPCRLQPCPEWGHWRQWSQCSTSCGIGSKTRQRVCNLPGQCVGR